MANIFSALNDISFGLDLLAALNGNVDSVAIYDSDNVQAFEKARPMKASIREPSRIMEQPVESGAVLADHHILNPVEIEVPLIIPSQYFVSTYQQVKNSYIQAQVFTIKTLVNVFKNMVISDMPHEENPDMSGAIMLGLRFRQVIYAVPGSDSLNDNYAPVDPQNSNTVQSGLQSAIALGTAGINQARSVLSYASFLRKF